ncbi:MAG: hypothetical protein ACJ754_04090 [Pyrinomonadaceae bacterium]
MTTKKVSKSKPEPEAGMTREEAQALASSICSQLEDMNCGGVQEFTLLLRYFAYKVTRDDAETVYIRSEMEYAYHFPGVDEAVRRELQTTLDALRERQKGAAR